MWSHYDEHLSVNVFFKQIQEHHNDIIEEATIQHWIICIPRAGTIDPTEITSDVILDHVLVFPTSFDEKKCYTLSKKQISIGNKQLFTDVDNTTNCIDILFEETFYVKHSKFIAWCIEQPLFLKYNLCDSHSSKNLSSLHDCIDFLWCESHSHGILDCIKIIISEFNFEFEIEHENIQSLKEQVGVLFSQCLQICFKNEILREKCMNNSLFLENLKLSVETYMQYCLGRKLIFFINTVNHQKDSYLNKIIKNCSDIQYQDLEINNDFSDTILQAKCELNQFNSYCTVLDKIHCLKKIINIIFDSGKNFKNSHVTSDDVLQILVFIILKLNVNNWFSNLAYIKEFQLSRENSDQNLYCISSLEAALEFITSTKFFDIKTTLPKNLESGEIAVNFLERRIKSGDHNTLLKIPSSSDPAALKSMCHPLCNCSKCQRIVKQQDSTIFETFMPFTEISQSLLIYATCLEKCEVIEFLLKMGSNIDFSDCFGRTSLHYAASKGLQHVLLLLINKQPNVNKRDNEKNTPLHLASLNGHENCVKALIYSTPDVELNIGNSFGDTPLIIAARWGYFEIVKILLENGASVVVKNKWNQTVFDVATNNYILKYCKKYTRIKKSDDINILDLDSILVISTQQDSCKSHGIRPRSTDQFKKIDVLLKAIENNDFPLACFYLGYSNSIQTVKNGSCHPLCVCDKCKNEQFDDFHNIEKNFTAVNVNMCDANGYTPLHTAAKFGRTDILRLLLDNGALPNVKAFKTLYTPLHLACINERIQTIKELLKCGDCNVDEQDAKGNTPLYYACQTGKIKIVEILLSNGADCNKKNFVDKSALMFSEENLQYGIFKLLKNHIQNALNVNVQLISNNLF